MRRIGIYGGTFNPPHMGHVRSAEYAVEALQLDKLLMIPAYAAPHKVLPPNTPSPHQRLQMLQISLGGNPKIEASDLEICREGISYTYETVAQVRMLYPHAQLFLLMGSDMFTSFSSWKCAQDILSLVTPVVLLRGEQAEREQIAQCAAQMPSAQIVYLNNPVTEISSTQMRRLLAFQCAEEYLPEGVGDYIGKHGLYDGNADYRGLSKETLEKVVCGLLKPNRVAHVLGCRDTAVRLARRYGVNETHAARAALLHDITKALDGPLQLTLCRAYGIVLDDFSFQNPKTLHALTGSLVAERVFGEDKAVVDAIRSHTTGKADMNLLEKIIYVADYMEPNRDFDGVEQMRRLADTDITAALRMGLNMTVDLLIRQNRAVSPESRQALEYLKQEEKGKE